MANLIPLKACINILGYCDLNDIVVENLSERVERAAVK